MLSFLQPSVFVANHQWCVQNIQVCSFARHSDWTEGGPGFGLNIQGGTRSDSKAQKHCPTRALNVYMFDAIVSDLPMPICEIQIKVVYSLFAVAWQQNSQ